MMQRINVSLTSRLVVLAVCYPHVHLNFPIGSNCSQYTPGIPMSVLSWFRYILITRFNVGYQCLISSMADPEFTRQGGNNPYSAIFSGKLPENERNWTERDPPWIRNDHDTVFIKLDQGGESAFQIACELTNLIQVSKN